MKKILTIAGADPSGGAGIQADLKTFNHFGVHGFSVITALTAQNSLGVDSISPVSPSFIHTQMDTLLKDFRPDSVKIGMLANEKIATAVFKKIRKNKFPFLVIDPIIKSKNGVTLLTPGGVKFLINKLFPLAYVVTPNIPEAEVILNMRIRTISDMKTAAKKIARMGPRNVIIKGGHLSGDIAVDILYSGNKYFTFESKYISGKIVHGTGCQFSAAITAGLAQKLSLKEAVGQAKDYLFGQIQQSLSLGSGYNFSPPGRKIFDRLMQAFTLLRRKKIGFLIPEVQSNLVCAPATAQKISEVMGFPARIIKKDAEIFTLCPPQLGGSSHLARVLLTAKKFNPFIGSAMNIKYSKEIISVCQKLKFTLAEFNRDDEPKNVKKIEGKSLDWGVGQAIEKTGFVPDIIFDQGGWGKEPMVRIFGKDPQDVVKKIILISKEYCRTKS